MTTDQNDNRPTPGPWVIEPHGKGYVLYAGRDNMHHGLNLVYLSDPDRNWESTKRLIELAPQMFELLEDIASFNGQPFPRRYNGKIVCATWVRLHEIIKRVKGNQ